LSAADKPAKQRSEADSRGVAAVNGD